MGTYNQYFLEKVMTMKVPSNDAGIPEHLNDKERRDWIKRALRGRPAASENQSNTIVQIDSKCNQSSPENDQVYSGKPKHLQ